MGRHPQQCTHDSTSFQDAGIAGQQGRRDVDVVSTKRPEEAEKTALGGGGAKSKQLGGAVSQAEAGRKVEPPQQQKRGERSCSHAMQVAGEWMDNGLGWKCAIVGGGAVCCES